MALELNVPVLALSQLNDQGRRRESRAIGQDADIVLKIDESQSEIRCLR
jgi:replicative DNA helicase